MESFSIDDAVDVSRELAYSAGRFAKDHRGESMMDQRAQELILQGILSAWPHQEFFLSAEENSESYKRFMLGFPESGSYRWLIDPIDGTSNYESGRSDDYAVSIGLEHDGGIVTGAVYFPERDQLYSFMKDKGVDRDGDRLPMLEDAPFSVDGYVMLSQTAYNISDLFPKSLRLRCACESFLSIAEGRRSSYLFSRTNVWDIGASLGMLKELGGVARNSEGRDLTTKGKLTSIQDDLYIACVGPEHFQSMLDYIRKRD